MHRKLSRQAFLPATATGVSLHGCRSRKLITPVTSRVRTAPVMPLVVHHDDATHDLWHLLDGAEFRRLHQAWDR